MPDATPLPDATPAVEEIGTPAAHDTATEVPTPPLPIAANG